MRASIAGGIARDAKRMWRPSCSLLKHGGGTLEIIKSSLCNYNNKKKLHSINHGPLSAAHNFMDFSILSERSGRRRPPAERSALYHTWYEVYIYKVPLRDVGIVKSRGRRKAKRESQVTHVWLFLVETRAMG